MVPLRSNIPEVDQQEKLPVLIGHVSAGSCLLQPVNISIHSKGTKKNSFFMIKLLLYKKGQGLR